MRTSFTLRVFHNISFGLCYYTAHLYFKTKHLDCWIFLLTFHLNSTLLPLYSGVVCNADFRECLT